MERAVGPVACCSDTHKALASGSSRLLLKNVILLLGTTGTVLEWCQSRMPIRGTVMCGSDGSGGERCKDIPGERSTASRGVDRRLRWAEPAVSLVSCSGASAWPFTLDAVFGQRFWKIHAQSAVGASQVRASTKDRRTFVVLQRDARSCRRAAR